MNRTLLVAWREYIENVRTKGFWIGIFTLPIILILLAFVPFLVDSTKEAKRYAVIDLSGDTLGPVSEIIARRDFRDFIEDFDSGRFDAVDTPTGLMTYAPEIRALEDDDITQVTLAIFAEEALPDGLTNRLRRYLSDNSGAVRDWWLALSDEERAALAGSASGNFFVRSRYTDDEATLNRRIHEGGLFAYFVIGPDPVSSSEGSKYVSSNLTDQDLKNWFSGIVTKHIRSRRMAESNIAPETADWISEPVSFRGSILSGEGTAKDVEATDVARQWAPMIFMYVLWISILMNTQMLLTNTIEEKSNKLIEVLLSSVSPIALMAGKVIGIAVTGLTIIGTWVLFALGLFIGVPVMAGVDLPFEIASVLADPLFVGSFLVYFLLGYLLYAALLVGLGALCDNLKEAQSLVFPVQIIEMIPLLVMVPISRDPNGTIAVVMSYVPPMTPFVMMTRAAGPPGMFEYAITTLLLMASIAGAFWLAAKLFRVGVLMTGKPPSVREIFRLLRAPVTAIERITIRNVPGGERD